MRLLAYLNGKPPAQVLDKLPFKLARVTIGGVRDDDVALRVVEHPPAEIIQQLKLSQPLVRLGAGHVQLRNHRFPVNQ